MLRLRLSDSSGVLEPLEDASIGKLVEFVRVGRGMAAREVKR